MAYVYAIEINKDMLSFKDYYFYLQEAKLRGGAKQKNATGWLKNSGGKYDWIPLDVSNEDEPDLHENPIYIYQLEPELEKKFQKEHPGYEYQYDDPEREALKDECINRGHIRVAEMSGMNSITLQARDLNTIKRGMATLRELFPNKLSKYEVLADVISHGQTKTFEWDPEAGKWLVFRGDSFF